MQEEQRKADRDLRQELQKNQMGMGMYNSLMSYATKPALTAAERQTALAAIPALKAVLPKEFHHYLDTVGQTIKAKPSVPEQNLDAAIKQGWEKIRLAQQRLALAGQRLAQGNGKDAWNALKMASSQVEQLRDNIRQIDVALGRFVPDPISLTPRPAIMGPERDRLMAQRDAMEKELKKVEEKRNALESRLLAGMTGTAPAERTTLTVNGKKVEIIRKD